jgi:Domain of unknown function (DUF1083).
MKKIISIASAIVLMAVLALPVFGYDYWNDAVSVSAAYGTPTIDGTVTGSEWDSAAAINVPLNGDPLEANGYVVYQGEWGTTRNDSDFSDMFKVMWDENNLYILEARKDDVVNLNGTANEPYLTDGTLVFLMPADDGSSANSVNPDGVHHHIFYTVGNGSGAIGGQQMDRYGDIASNSQVVQDVTGGKIASSLTAGGYIVELAFPWSQLGEGLTDAFKGPTDNMKLGFSLVIHDSDATDGSTGFVKQLCWGIMDSANYDYGGWAVLTLNAKPTETAAPTTEAPAAETPATDTTTTETTAPTTADFTAIAVFAACVTAAGAFIISRKKK